MDYAEFRSTRASNALTGLGLLSFTACVVYVGFFMNETEFLGTRARRGGFLKIIEQTIGWELFVALLLAFAAWAAVYGVVSLWKAVDSTPDVTALPDRLEFHPAVRGAPASYSEISHWSVEIVSGHPVLWLHFHEKYWSLQGLWKRKTVKLEGDKEQVTPLFEFLCNHPIMREKFVR
ncbi:hypothetical protein [Sphingopyxis sp.]|uniref:hypothetical protein n=1 Tax=Sphingopyxis sp. TaxID=1908224 RepID=UPI003BAC0658